jgi:hypothetical protein
MGSFSPCDWAFDHNVVDFVVELLFLPFVLEIQIGASSDCVNGSEGW